MNISCALCETFGNFTIAVTRHDCHNCTNQTVRNQIENVDKNSKYYIGVHVEGNLEVYVYEMTIRMDMKISYKR